MWIGLRLFKILIVIVINKYIVSALTSGAIVENILSKREIGEGCVIADPDCKDCKSVLFCDNALCSLLKNLPS